MTSNGYTNEHTLNAAMAIDNTREFYFGPRAAAVSKALDGDISGAAADLRHAAVSQGILPGHVNVDDVDFTQLITKAAEEAAR